MRGSDERNEGLFSYVGCKARVPADHPLWCWCSEGLADASKPDPSFDQALRTEFGRA